jgi:hypothetical protein
MFVAEINICEEMFFSFNPNSNSSIENKFGDNLTHANLLPITIYCYYHLFWLSSYQDYIKDTL